MRKKFEICAILILFLNLFPDNPEKILTPDSENSIVAKMNGEAVKEFEVFGYPASVKERKQLSIEERNRTIYNYIFERILQTEGNVTDVLNSEDYKGNYDNLISKNSVEYLRQSLLNEKFFNKKAVEKHYKTDKQKFSKNGVRNDELIIADLKKIKDKEIKKFVKDYLDKLKKDNNVRYRNEIFTEISKIKAKDPEEFSEKLKEIGLTKELIAYEDQQVQVNQLYNQIKEIKPYHLGSLSDIETLKAMIDGRILNSLLIKEARKKGIRENKTVIEQTKEQLKYFVGRKYIEILTSDDKFIPTKDEMIDYYIAHKNEESLKSKRKMWVFEIFREYSNKDSIDNNDKIQVAIELENIRQKIIKGDDFEKYAKFYPRPHTKDGELGFIFETDHAMVGKTAAKMNEGDISDLIIQEKAISVIKVTKVQEPMLYKFEYVEEIIKRNLIEMKREKFLENLRNELFKKYRVELVGNNTGETK